MAGEFVQGNVDDPRQLAHFELARVAYIQKGIVFAVGFHQLQQAAGIDIAIVVESLRRCRACLAEQSLPPVAGILCSGFAAGRTIVAPIELHFIEVHEQRVESKKSA